MNALLLLMFLTVHLPPHCYPGQHTTVSTPVEVGGYTCTATDTWTDDTTFYATAMLGGSGGAVTCPDMPALTGDTTSSAGSCATTTTKTGGVSFAPSATTDTTDAGNITSGTLANGRTTAASANTASAIVARDGSGNFSAGTITASLTGNVTGNVSGSSGSTTGNAATATALAGNGSNCSAGNYPLGVDASGAVETCTADDDQPDNDSEVPDAITVSGGAVTNSDITLKQSATPTPTAEGRVEWDTDDDRLAVGDSSGTKIIYPGPHAGAASDGGAATTASALAADGGNCSAGQIPLGVDTAGAVQGCYAPTSTTVGLANVTNDAQTKAAVVPNTAPSSGQVLVGNAGGTAYAPQTLSQDCTLASTGAITCTKTNNTSFATVATSGAKADVGLGSVTNDAQTKAAIVPNTAPSAGQVLAGNAGGTAYAPVSMSQDCTMSSAGVMTCTKTNNVSFATSATTDTSTPTYITQTASGNLSAEQAMGSLGTGLVKNTTTTGVQSIYAGTSCTNQFPRSLDASGAATCASVATTDIASQAARSVLGNATSGAAVPTATTTVDVLTYQTAEIASFVRVATSDFTTANNTNLQAITGLTWTMPASTALNIPFSCFLQYSIATAAVAVSFGIQDVSIAPTAINAQGLQYTSATASTEGTLVNLASTTATAIVTATPSAITTVWMAQLHGMIEQPSNASSSAINIMVKTAAGADVVSVKRGSFCTVGF